MTTNDYSQIADRLREAASFAENPNRPDVSTPGIVIALYRIASGVSAADVARRIGVSRQRVSGIEAGKATPDTAARLRKAIDELAA